MDNNFTHLHVHTDASKDGLRPVSALVETAWKKGFKALAMTDHGTLANAVSFTVEAESRGIKPILGLEAYVEVDGQTGHLTVLADGNEGFNNLVRLNNIGHASDFKYPAVTIDQLMAHSKGLVLLSGCVSSPLNNMPYRDALALTARLKTAFADRFFGEAMFIADTATHERAMSLAKDAKLKMVITGDVHFPSANDAPVHKILTQLRAGYDYNSSQLFLQSRAQTLTLAKRFISEDLANEWMDRSFAIGNHIKAVKLKRAPTLPHIDMADEKLVEKVMKKAEEIGDKRYVERAAYEIGVIAKMGFSTYFLILDDIISFATRSGVRVGPGRGSGAGSLVLFLLGITTIDPLKYDLPFERFLNPERVGMPDVDTDFDSENRQIAIDYAKRKWNATPIATYSRFSHKILVHDLARHFRVTRELDEKAADEGPDSEAFAQVVDETEGFGEAYYSIVDQIRHKGTHAGGVIVTDVAVPIERTGSMLTASWTEGQHNELSYAGVVKFDFLGLAALSILRRLETKHHIHAPEPTDDAPELEIFRSGKLEGIFQFSGSAGIRELTIKLQPNTFYDLVAINALYRPGALDVGSTAMYPEWKKTPRVVNPLIADILAPTYGAIVFQEQVMQVFARIMGGTLGSADEARRVIVKSKETDPEWVKKFEALKMTFLGGCLERGLHREESEELWKEIAAHSRYSFNKAHSVAYATVAWYMAWWKYHYPADFYAEMLNIDPTSAQSYLVSAAREGITISEPHVNQSGVEYTANDGVIYMPLAAVKFLSATSAQAIVDARKERPFESCEDFMKRVPKKLVRGQARNGLLALNAFYGIDTDSKFLLTKPVEEMTKTEKQVAYLGIIIPTPKMLKAIENAAASGFISGLVVEIEQKTSGYGPYKVFRLVPMATFWARKLDSAERLKPGDCVAVQTKKDSGKALKIYKLEIT